MFRKAFVLFYLSAMFTLGSRASYTLDTVSLTLKQAEARFIDSNLNLLIAKTNIDVQRALEIQAKLFDNPNISYNHNFYNPDTKHFFSVAGKQADGSTPGELGAQLQQLVRIAGKRKNQVKLAQYNTQLTEYQYYDLLRTLKYQLRADMAQIDFCIQNAETYTQQITILNQLIDATDYQVKHGNISEKELVRLQNNLLSLRTDERSNYESMLDAQNDLKSLLKYSGHEFLKPTLSVAKDITEAIRNIGIDSLDNIAVTERYDIKAAKVNADMTRVNLKLQRSLGVPDPTFFIEYDRFGSAFNNYTGLGVSIDLPVFNRNQGNIRSAKAAIKAADYNSDNAYLNMRNDVETSLLKMLNITAVRKGFDEKYNSSFNKVSQGMLDLFKERKISLLEFLDFFDSYGDARRNINQLNSDYRQGIYELNYTLGRDVF